MANIEDVKVGQVWSCLDKDYLNGLKVDVLDVNSTYVRVLWHHSGKRRHIRLDSFVKRFEKV